MLLKSHARFSLLPFSVIFIFGSFSVLANAGKMYVNSTINFDRNSKTLSWNRISGTVKYGITSDNGGRIVTESTSQCISDLLGSSCYNLIAICSYGKNNRVLDYESMVISNANVSK